MGSELAWTVAKYGGFHINKQLKLYRSIHGHVPISKVSEHKLKSLKVTLKLKYGVTQNKY